MKLKLYEVKTLLLSLHACEARVCVDAQNSSAASYQHWAGSLAATAQGMST